MTHEGGRGQTKCHVTYPPHFCAKFHLKYQYDVTNRGFPNGRKHRVGVTADVVGPRAQPGRRELEEDQSRCQSHQHLSHTFFVRKYFAHLKLHFGLG